MTPAIGYAIRKQDRLILDDPAINAAEISRRELAAICRELVGMGLVGLA